MSKDIAEDGCTKIDAGAFKYRTCNMCGKLMQDHSGRMFQACVKKAKTRKKTTKKGTNK